MECAGAVDSTTVRSPAWAQLRAVAAAVVVLPTPPLPVKSRTLVTRRARSRLHVVPQLAQRGVDDLALGAALDEPGEGRSEEHTSELQSLMRISYAVFCLKKQKITQNTIHQEKNSHNNK